MLSNILYLYNYYNTQYTTCNMISIGNTLGQPSTQNTVNLKFKSLMYCTKKLLLRWRLSMLLCSISRAFQFAKSLKVHIFRPDSNSLCKNVKCFDIPIAEFGLGHLVLSAAQYSAQYWVFENLTSFIKKFWLLHK